MPLVKKISKYAEDICTLEQHIDILDHDRELIIDNWMNNVDITKLFEGLKIGPDEFKRNYAEQIIVHYIDVARKEKELSSCPVINRLLGASSYYKKIEFADLYVIYVKLKETIIDHFFNLNTMSSSLYKDITYVFDKNFEDLLRLYGNTIFQIEQEVEEYKQVFSQYNVALDQSALVSKTDINGVITYVNPNFVQISGYSEDELIGYKHNIIRHPDTPNDFFERLWKTIKSGNTFRGNIKNRKKDGSAYYVDTTILPLYDIDKNIKEFLSVRYEVSDLVKARDIAIQAEKSKDIFLANMSHEIRTPLNAILGFIDVLKKRTTDQESLKYINTIKSSGNALLTIISDILDFAKLRNGNLDINIEEFDLLKELGITINLFSKNAAAKKIDYSYVVESKLPKKVMSDTVRINQILSNFLSNAVKFTPESGTVTTSICVDDGRLIISVTDSGEGMDEEQQSRIFNAFEQAEKTTTKKHGGTGLGLAISLKLANHMGGDITVKSEPGKGSTFTLDIPIEYDENELIEMSIEAEHSSDDEGIEEKNQYEGHILVAEDNKANQMLISILLDEFGLSFDIANDGKEAYEMYENNRSEDKKVYDLVLMDNQMPVMNGVESTQKIREIEQTNQFSKTPIVALTANALKGDREYFLSKGLDDYVKKPIDIQDLERVLMKTLHKKK